MPGPGKRFQVGNPGGPGRPAMPDDIKAAKKLTKDELDRVLYKFMDMTHEDLAMLLHKDNPDMGKMRNLDMIVASIVMHAKKFGDQRRLDFILDRAIGKVSEKVEITAPRPTVIKLLNNEGEIHLTSEEKLIEEK